MHVLINTSPWVIIVQGSMTSRKENHPVFESTYKIKPPGKFQLD